MVFHSSQDLRKTALASFFFLPYGCTVCGKMPNQDNFASVLPLYDAPELMASAHTERSVGIGVLIKHQPNG